MKAIKSLKKVTFFKVARNDFIPFSSPARESNFQHLFLPLFPRVPWEKFRRHLWGWEKAEWRLSFLHVEFIACLDADFSLIFRIPIKFLRFCKREIFLRFPSKKVSSTCSFGLEQWFCALRRDDFMVKTFLSTEDYGLEAERVAMGLLNFSFMIAS